jgi:hypothetical protein
MVKTPSHSPPAVLHEGPAAGDIQLRGCIAVFDLETSEPLDRLVPVAFLVQGQPSSKIETQGSHWQRPSSPQELVDPDGKLLALHPDGVELAAEETVLTISWVNSLMTTLVRIPC